MNKKSKNKKSKTYAVTGLELFQIALVIMKLADIGSVKNWSWWWVMSPTWIPIGMVIAIFIFYCLFVFIFNSVQDNKYL